MDKGQVGYYSKGELELIRNTFKDNDELLYELRNVMFGFSNQTKQYTPEVLAVIKKTLLPELTPNVPLGKQDDLYQNLKVLKDIIPEQGINLIKAQDIVIEYLNNRFSVLKGVSSVRKLSDLKEAESKDDERRYLEMVAYNFLVDNYIDQRIYNLQALANYKEETEEEKKARLAKDSTK